MLEVFPQVTLWRGDFLARKPIVALIGQQEPAELDPGAMRGYMRRLGRHEDASDEALEALAALMYAGNLTMASELFAASPLNTDDRPLIEFLAPVTQREQRHGTISWLVSAELARFYGELRDRAPIARDPYLTRLDDRQRQFVRAGDVLYEAVVSRDLGDRKRALERAGEFRDLVPWDVERMFRNRLEEIER
jgi:spermidine synthase